MKSTKTIEGYQTEGGLHPQFDVDGAWPSTETSSTSHVALVSEAGVPCEAYAGDGNGETEADIKAWASLASQVSPACLAALRASTSIIRQALTNQTLEAVRIGNELIAREDELKKTKAFVFWVENVVGLDKRLAQLYMKMATHFEGRADGFHALPYTVAQKLAENGDDDLTTQVISRVHDGERLKVREVRALISASKTESADDTPLEHVDESDADEDGLDETLDGETGDDDGSPDTQDRVSEVLAVLAAVDVKAGLRLLRLLDPETIEKAIAALLRRKNTECKRQERARKREGKQ